MVEKKFLIFLIGLTIFSLVIRAFRLTEPGHYYFDEVYHAVTAKAYADNNRDAYNPFSPAPKEGTAYDWLHPPLAKLIQAASIKVLGDRPIAWRLPSLIFGTSIIPLTFILAFLLFGSTVAIFASLVIAFENLTFVMSRITMNDVFIVSFSLCAFIFAVLFNQKKKFEFLVSSSIFLGFALSSKWTGAYSIAAVLGYLLWPDLVNRRFNFKLLLLIVIPVLMYLGAYGQFWIQKHTLADFVNLHKQIWWYQNRHDLEHSYGTTALYCVPNGLNGPKTWCPWILNVRGAYFSYEQYGSPRPSSAEAGGEAGDKAGYIYALGNPLIFWAGVVSISYVLGRFLEKRKKEYALVLLGYFIFWVPWIFAPRLMFLYHYLPALPFLAIALGVSMSEIYRTKFKVLAIIIVLIFVAAFFYFYPISSGLAIDPASIDKYMWLKTWR